MKTTQPHINRDKTQTLQLPQLQPLKLEQLEGVAGGPDEPLCPPCDCFRR